MGSAAYGIMSLEEALDAEVLRKYVDQVYLYAEYPFTSDSEMEFLWGSEVERTELGDVIPEDYVEFASVRECEHYLSVLGDTPELVIAFIMEES